MAVLPTRRERFWVRATLLGFAGLGVAVGVFVLATFKPTDSSYYPKCMSHQLLGLHCPGCGTTRALHSLLNGQLLQAVAYNAIALVALPYVLFSIGRSAWFFLRGETCRTIIWPKVLLWTFVVVLFLYGVARNIPAYPFTLLAPHELP